MQAFLTDLLWWFGMGAFACVIAIIIDIDPDQWRNK